MVLTTRFVVPPSRAGVGDPKQPAQIGTIRPPALLSLALPHLPPPLPTIILTVLKYLQIGGIFLNDIAALLFGVGFFVWLSSWLAP